MPYKFLDFKEVEITNERRLINAEWVLKCVPTYSIAAIMATYMGESKIFKSALDQYLMLEQLYVKILNKNPIDDSLIRYVSQLNSRDMAANSLYGVLVIKNTAKKELLRDVLIHHIRDKKLTFEKWNASI